MSVAIVTGSGGLIGSETVRFLHGQGMDVVGVDNDMRTYFFGPDASTAWNTAQLESRLPRFSHRDLDVRDREGIDRLFQSHGSAISLVVHTAAQPSHDWAAKEPFTDFTINANGTLVMLEALRRYCPEAVFIFTSTNKVYGDTPNVLPLVEEQSRWEIDAAHPYAEHGIDETMSIDTSKHSLFGASKVAADILTQEYGRYFGLKTGTFRGGCLTGPAHSGAELHGFLAYLVRCALLGIPYTIYGYKGKQVRDNIHSRDLVTAFWEFFRNPRPGEVYNIGGSRHSNCSVLEAIQDVSRLCGRELDYTIAEQARSGDHIWWISDVRKFQLHFPNWRYEYDLPAILTEIRDAIESRISTKTT
jgi:CDP-paratose 2-epimerase